MEADVLSYWPQYSSSVPGNNLPIYVQYTIHSLSMPTPAQRRKEDPMCASCRAIEDDMVDLLSMITFVQLSSYRVLDLALWDVGCCFWEPVAAGPQPLDCDPFSFRRATTDSATNDGQSAVETASPLVYMVL